MKSIPHSEVDQWAEGDRKGLLRRVFRSWSQYAIQESWQETRDEHGWERMGTGSLPPLSFTFALFIVTLWYSTTFYNIHSWAVQSCALVALKGCCRNWNEERYLKRAAANVHMAVFGNLVCNLLNSSTKNSPGSDFQGVTSRYELQESSVDVRLGGGQKQGIEAQLLPLLASPSS